MQKVSVFFAAIFVCLAGCHVADRTPATPGDASPNHSSTSHTWVDESLLSSRAENRDLLPIEVGSKWGYTGRDGVIKITPQYDSAYLFVYDLAEICVGGCTYDKPGKHGLINTSGQFAVSPVYDSIGDIEGELIPVCVGSCKWGDADQKWGFVNRKGDVVIPLQFGQVRAFSEGVAAVCIGTACTGLNQNGKWGYIDRAGHFVINPQYDDAGEMVDGVAQITVGTGKDAKLGYIDKTGKAFYNPTN